MKIKQKIESARDIGRKLLAIGKRLVMCVRGNQDAAAAIEKTRVLVESIAGGAQHGKTPLDVRDYFRTGPGNQGGC